MNDIIKHTKANVVNRSGGNSLERLLNKDQSQYSDTAVLLDSSGSMNAVISSVTLWDHLLHAVNIHFKDSQVNCIVFGSIASIEDIENPKKLGGGTNMQLAFRLVNEKLMPGIKNIILISDGLPTCHEQDIFDECEKGGFKVDCIYIGEDNSRGAEFLKNLSSKFGGKEYTVGDNQDDIKFLKNAIKGFLPEKTIKL